MSEVADYLRQAALARGMDPDKVLRAVMTEGGVSDPFQQSFAKKNGIREPSYGPLQLLIGGEGTGFPEGLGNRALAAGIDPRKNWQAGVDFGLDTVAKEGWQQWYGPKNAGLDRWYGVRGAKPVGTTINSIGNPGGYASEGPINAAASRVAPPLPPAYSVADRPIGDAMPAKFDVAGGAGLMDMLKSFGGNETGMGGLSAMAGAFGGGSQSSAPQIQPSSIGPAVSNEIAAKAASAQQLMAALLAGKRPKKRSPGLSMMG